MTKLKRTKKRKLWSVPRISHPQFPGYMLRVTELVAGGDLYFVRMISGKQKMALLRPRCTRLDLGSDEREQKQSACARAFEIIEALAEGKDADAEATEAGAPLTLGVLTTLYELHGLHGTGASYKRDQVAKLRRFSAFLGGERRVVSLCQSDIRKFEAHRLKGGVRRSTVHGDLDALKIACTWAVEHKRADGQTLLNKNPLAKVRVQRDTPRRPWCTPERYERLQGVADQLPPAFGVVLSVAWESGRRLRNRARSSSSSPVCTVFGNPCTDEATQQHKEASMKRRRKKKITFASDEGWCPRFVSQVFFLSILRQM